MIFRFATPWLLAMVPVVLAAAWWAGRRRRTADARVRLPRAHLAADLRPGVWLRIDRSLPWFRGFAMVLLVLAVARPQSGSRVESVSTLGVDIVLAIDISGSMRAEDFEPLNRLEMAKRTVDRFVTGRPADRLGLVAFGALATTRCPLTLDHEMFRSFLEAVDFAPEDQDGTAIGMGLATAVNRLRASSAKSKVVVLLTDGRNNRGQIGPEDAAEVARALEVRVYTVGVGTEGEAPFPVRTPFGTTRRWVRVDLDEELLRSVAAATGGRYFRATDTEGLESVFATIDALEKTEIQSRVRTLYTERFPMFLFPAAILLSLEGLLSATRLRRVP